MLSPESPGSPPPRGPARGLSRRGLLGGALAAALAAVLPIRDNPVKAPPDRWRGKTRWIGHC